MSKDLREQELGRQIYQEHKKTYKVDLANGTLPQIGGYPPSTLQNIRVGIAYEALKEENFEAANAFFSHLGDDYQELVSFTSEMARRNPDETKDSNLVNRISRILNHKTRHDFVRREVDDLAARHGIITGLKSGSFTLAQRLGELQEEYSALQGLSRREKKERKGDLEDYTGRFMQALAALGEFYTIEKPEEMHFDKKTGRKVIGQIIGSGGFLTGTVGTLACLFGGIITGNPLLAAAALPSLIGGVVTSEAGEAMVNGVKAKDIRKVFREAQGKAEGVDKIVQSAYMPSYYSNNPEVFKERFKTMDVSEKQLVIKELLATQKNDGADEWLAENYKELIEDEGRWNLVN